MAIALPFRFSRAQKHAKQTPLTVGDRRALSRDVRQAILDAMHYAADIELKAREHRISLDEAVTGHDAILEATSAHIMAAVARECGEEWGGHAMLANARLAELYGRGWEKRP